MGATSSKEDDGPAQAAIDRRSTSASPNPVSWPTIPGSTARTRQAAERLGERGEPVRRVVLEEELKREYQRFLQAQNRERRERGETPEGRAEAVARWAQEHELPFDDGHVQFPDARIEYEDRDGRRAVENIEVVTPHYRGAHAAAKGRSGFTCYRASGARLGGLRTTGRSGRGVDPRLAEELLS